MGVCYDDNCMKDVSDRGSPQKTVVLILLRPNCVTDSPEDGTAGGCGQSHGKGCKSPTDYSYSESQSCGQAYV